MRCAKIVGIAGLLLLTAGSAPVQAGPQGFGPAASLSAAAGGTLDSDLGEAGSLAQRIDYSSITLLPGRSIEYRRRVALERQLAAQAKSSADSLTGIPGRIAD